MKNNLPGWPSKPSISSPTFTRLFKQSLAACSGRWFCPLAIWRILLNQFCLHRLRGHRNTKTLWELLECVTPSLVFFWLLFLSYMCLLTLLTSPMEHMCLLTLLTSLMEPWPAPQTRFFFQCRELHVYSLRKKFMQRQEKAWPHTSDTTQTKTT